MSADLLVLVLSQKKRENKLKKMRKLLRKQNPNLTKREMLSSRKKLKLLMKNV